MSRSNYFNYIEKKFSELASSIEIRGKLNILDLHVHSENFYMHLFNQLFGWSLANCNTQIQNIEAIDLFDSTNEIIIQVSATASKQKVESALTKDLSKYHGFSFKFISISKDASELRNKTFNNPYKLLFDPKTDIHDIPSILRLVSSLHIDELRGIYELIDKELGAEDDPQKLQTNLAAIIDLISKENLGEVPSGYQINAFEIQRKIEVNSLKLAKVKIDEYKVHHNTIDKIYSEFNKFGSNKSKSVLDSINGIYLEKCKLNSSDDDTFFAIMDTVIARIQQSSNYIVIPFEELELCVNILIVDAFIRCKIFKNPMESDNAAS